MGHRWTQRGRLIETAAARGDGAGRLCWRALRMPAAAKCPAFVSKGFD